MSKVKITFNDGAIEFYEIEEGERMAGITAVGLVIRVKNCNTTIVIHPSAARKIEYFW